MFILLHPLTMAAAEKQVARAAMQTPPSFLESTLNFGNVTYFACAEEKASLEWFCSRTGLNGLILEGEIYDQQDTLLPDTADEFDEEEDPSMVNVMSQKRASTPPPQQAPRQAPPQRTPPAKVPPVGRPMQPTPSAPRKGPPKGFNK